MIKAGPPHFKQLAKQHRQSNYTFSKFINECIDNVIKKCNTIHIRTVVDDGDADSGGKLLEIWISDNYKNGFDNINETGSHNPFNMGHFNVNHDNDDETSEFGVGLKSGSISVANKLEVITRVPAFNENYYVCADFIRMSNEKEVELSYNPIIKKISDEEYKNEYRHPFEQGSTIKVSNFRDSAYNTTTQEMITFELINSLSKTYYKWLEHCDIYVNDEKVNPPYDYFKDEACIPFIETCYIYILRNNKYKYMYFAGKKYYSGIQKIFEYDTTDKKWKESEFDKMEGYMKNGYKLLYTQYDKDHCIEINTTTVYYSENDKELPNDTVNIYKDNRLYCSEPLVKHNDGYFNHVIHEINFKSKDIGKHIGITYNKEINIKNQNNDLVELIKNMVSMNGKRFSTGNKENLKSIHKHAVEQKLQYYVNEKNKKLLRKKLEKDTKKLEEDDSDEEYMSYKNQSKTNKGKTQLKETPKEQLQEPRKEQLKETSKELLQEPKKEQLQEPPKEQLQEPREEQLKETPKELLKEPPKEKLQEDKKELLQETQKEKLQEPKKEQPQETPKEKLQGPKKEQPQETPKEQLQEPKKEQLQEVMREVEDVDNELINIDPNKCFIIKRMNQCNDNHELMIKIVELIKEYELLRQSV